MKRLLLVGLVGIAFLTAVGLVAVALLDRSAPAPPAPPSVAERPLPPLPPLPPRPAPPAAAPGTEPPPAPEPVPPSPADPVPRLQARGPLRRDTLTGLEALADSVRACHLPDAAITLTLETLEGRVRVAAVALRPAGAPAAETPGPAAAPLDEAGVRCVTAALEGQSFESQIARPGRRWEMPWAPGTAP